MGTSTTNYELYKPAEGEKGWADEVNGNFDTIDDRLDDVDTRSENIHASAGSALTISSGVITVGDETFYQVNGESSADDDLVTINGGSTGKVIILMAGSKVITLKTTGNIQPQFDADKVLSTNGQSTITLRHNGTDWVEIASTVRPVRLGFVLGGAAGISEDDYVDWVDAPPIYITQIVAEADASGSLDMDVFADNVGSEPTTKVADFALSSQQRKTDSTLTSVTRAHGVKTWRLQAMGDATTIKQISVVISGWTR